MAGLAITANRKPASRHSNTPKKKKKKEREKPSGGILLFFFVNFFFLPFQRGLVPELVISHSLKLPLDRILVNNYIKSIGPKYIKL